MTQVHDVIIIGAGPGGSAAAHYLAGAGLDVLLLDKADFPRDKTCGDALTPRALRALADMGLLDAVLQEGASHSTVEFIAPRGHTASAEVKSRGGDYNFVHVIPRLLLDNLILRRALASGAQFKPRTRVVAIEREEQCMAVIADCDRLRVTSRGRIVIIATGASTTLPIRVGLLQKVPPLMLACRAYYEGIALPHESVQCRFDGVPLPGYGWVFPLSTTRANVGAGIFRAGLAARWMPSTAQAVFKRFVQTPALQDILAHAKLDGPVKGYPIRINFSTAQTYADRILLVGEAAGLVNPVTGEGIDYALESARMAAEHVTTMFASGDFTTTHLQRYDQQLRQMYQRLFTLCDRFRLIYLNPLVVNRVIMAAARQPTLRELYMNIAMENQDVLDGLSLKTLSKVVFR